MKRKYLSLITVFAVALFFSGIAFAQDVLPFPEPPSASKAGKTLKESKHQWRKTPNRLPVERSVPGTFTASETFDVGKDLCSPVALDYFDRAPFAFNGKIEKIHISYIE